MHQFNCNSNLIMFIILFWFSLHFFQLTQLNHEFWSRFIFQCFYLKHIKNCQQFSMSSLLLIMWQWFRAWFKTQILYSLFMSWTFCFILYKYQYQYAKTSATTSQDYSQKFCRFSARSNIRAVKAIRAALSQHKIIWSNQKNWCLSLWKTAQSKCN